MAILVATDFKLPAMTTSSTEYKNNHSPVQISGLNLQEFGDWLLLRSDPHQAYTVPYTLLPR